MENLFIPIGGGNEIGASCYFYQIGEVKFVVDSGIRFSKREPFPDFEFLKALAPELDAILITHAHIDHCGSIHALSELYPETPIFTTHETAQLLALMVEDAIKVRYINQRNSQEEWKEYKLLDKALSRVERRDFFDPIVIKDAEFYLYPAGHILGASSVVVKFGENKQLYHSGDISLTEQKTVKGALLPKGEETALLVSESTYLYSRKRFDRQRSTEEFYKSVRETVERGGKVLIPAFALGRAQEIILILSEGMKAGEIPPITVYVDGLAREITNIYSRLLDLELFNYFVQPAPTYEGLSFKEACRENLREAQCILSTSGMLMEGTPSFVYGKLLSKNPKNSILLSGYLVEESFGYKLINDKETLKEFKCQIKKHHFSAHSDREELERIKEELSPKKCVFVHGYPGVKEFKGHAHNREVVRF
ncbi:MBL fold metallo-hydrolase [Thermovibrio sp.]